MRRARPILAALLAAMAVTAPAGAATLAPVDLPGDHGAHPQFGVEWWYTTGRATTPDGRRYFWFATIWTAPQGSIGRVNVVDLARDRVVLARQWTTLTPFAAGTTDLRAGGLHLRWRPGGRYGRLTIDARVGVKRRLQLHLTPKRPYALHGDHGIVPQGPAGSSAYYSATRLATAGRLRTRGRARRLRGLGWFDHEWGDFASAPGALRWDWFACQLADGRDLMLTQFLDAADQPVPGVAHGTLVHAGGGVTAVDAFTTTPLGPVLHPSGAAGSYPLGWHLQVPSAGLDLTLRAAARHQFVTMRYLPSFWEGAAKIVSGPDGACTVEDSREAPAG